MKHRPIRFEPDQLDHALIDWNSPTNEFKPESIALILNQSFDGALLLLHWKGSPIHQGENIQVQIGKLLPKPAEIVWVTELEPHIFKIGLKIKLEF